MQQVVKPSDLLNNQVGLFYRALLQDKRLRSAHVCLYWALLLMWQKSDFNDIFTVTRKELMQLSRIGSITTYQKCIYELVWFGYIKYKPTFNAYIGTKVQLIIRQNHPE